MKIVLILSGCLLSVTAVDIMDNIISNGWTEYKFMYNKTYTDNEDYRRKEVYKENRNNKKKINNNEMHKEKQASFTTYISHMTDKLSSEIKLKNRKVGSSSPTGKAFVPSPYATSRLSVDWRSSGLVTEVRQQGHCGCSYAIASAGALEGQMFKIMKQQNSKTYQLGIQRIIDCSSQDGNYGCKGGLVTTSYEYIMRVGGLEAEANYPYKAEVGQCMANPNDHKISISGYYVIKPGDEQALVQAVDKYGPVAISMDASRYSFGAYKTGIYHDADCSSVNTNHAALIVGYGTDQSQKKELANSTCNGADYWIIKNSWGTDWGENGYFRLARGCNHCGISQMATYPIVNSTSQPIKSTIPASHKQPSSPLVLTTPCQ